MESSPDATAVEMELLRRVSHGDQAAFAALYGRYAGVVFSTAFKVLNNQAAAEDVLQDVFIQIWDKAAMYDPLRGKPITWAVTLTRNKSIDRLRSTQRRGRLRDDLEHDVQTLERFDDKSAIDSVDAMEMARIVREAVRQLSDDQRESIELAFFSGLTQAEIAEKLGEPLGTVKARIRRGMMKLRDLVEPVL
jgi:RNA polymerase sigma-70 factor (ECF subfamily)